MDLITGKAERSESEVAFTSTLQASGANRDFALDLIRQGICFVIAEQKGKPFFSASRFIGCRLSTRHDHIHNEDKYGRGGRGNSQHRLL